MPTFPRNLVDETGRNIIPIEAEWPTSPPPLRSPGFSGKDQVRSTTQRGYAWRERFGLLSAGDPAVRKLLAYVRTWHREGTILDVEHVSMEKLGAGGGTPTVSGASQTGSSIVTAGWPNSTAILKAGDFLRFSGLNGAYEVTADVSSDGSGNATIGITPPIFAGDSPSNGAAVTIADIGVAFFKARIVDVIWPAGAGSQSAYYSGLTLTFKEAL